MAIIIVLINYKFIQQQQIIRDRLRQIMEPKQLGELLHKIRYNCQYLSHIHHRKQVNQCMKIQNINQKQLCCISVAKVFVQVTYLLYTCHLLKTDIFISTKPIYFKKSNSSLLQLRLIFYLSQQQNSPNFDSLHEDRFSFVQFKAHRFNHRVVQFLPNIFTNIMPFLAEKPMQQTLTQPNLHKLIDFINKYMRPKIMDNPDYPLIKHIESTELFFKFSDLLLGLRSSIFYQIKKKEEIVFVIKNMKENMQNKMHYLAIQKNWHHIYKIVDNFLLQLINNQILNMKKSSTRDDKSGEHFLVGYLNKTSQNGKQIQKYFARFYSLDNWIGQEYKNEKSDDEIKKIDKNIYTFQFSAQNFTICVRYITFLQANSESIDIISSYCANIAYQDSKILLQTLDLVRNPIKNNQIKKYIVFKIFYRVQKSEEPLTKILVAIQYVTICAKIYLDLIIKKPGKDQIAVIQQFSKRLDHLLKLFVNKADNFYKNM